jgi:hypothetical protein
LPDGIILRLIIVLDDAAPFVFGQRGSLNLSYFVARKIWR